MQNYLSKKHDEKTVENSMPVELMYLILFFYPEEEWEEIFVFLYEKLEQSNVQINSASYVALTFLLGDLIDKMEEIESDM